METCPQPGSTPTCDTAGILGPIVGVIASIEAAEAIKILSGNRDAVSRYLTVVDIWQNHIKQVDVSRLRDEVDCPTCKRGEYPWLSGREGGQSAVLCGRNAVQFSHPETSISLADLARRLAGTGPITLNQYLLRLKVPPHEITVFPDGRAIVTGTDDISAARTLYAKYIGT